MQHKFTQIPASPPAVFPRGRFLGTGCNNRENENQAGWEMAEGGARESSLHDSYNLPLLDRAPVGGRAQGGFYLVPQILLYLTVLVGQVSRHGIAVWFRLRVSPQVAVKLLVKAAVV